MSDYVGLTHSKWYCKNHAVFIPKFRKKQLFCEIRKYLGNVFHESARQKESKIMKRLSGPFLKPEEQ